MAGRRGWMWLSLLLALITGASAGVLADRVALRDRLHVQPQLSSSSFLWFSCDEQDVEQDPAYPFQPRYRDFLVNRLSSRLQLDDQQVVALDAMLESKRDYARTFWSGTRDAYCRMQESFRADIRALLRPEQVTIYQQLLAEIDARHRERFQSGQRAPGRGRPEVDRSAPADKPAH